MVSPPVPAGESDGTSSALLGARVVHRAEMDKRDQTLRSLFSPLEGMLHPDFKVGCTVVDRLTGYTAEVIGVAPHRDADQVLYMHMQGHCGATPFLPGEAFIHRWLPVSGKGGQPPFLEEGMTFTVPNLTHMSPSELALTGLAGPFPVDVSVITNMGIQRGTVVAKHHGGCDELQVVGVACRDSEVGVISLVLFDPSTEKYVDAETGVDYVVVSQSQPPSFEPITADYRTVVYKDQPARADAPLNEHWQFPISTNQAVLFDVDDAKCESYFGVVPRDIINGSSVVIGMRYKPGTKRQVVQLYTAKETENHATPLVDGVGITVAREKYPVHRRETQPRRQSLRAEPTGEPNATFVIPETLPSDLDHYVLSYQYPHLTKRVKLHDLNYAQQHVSEHLVPGRRFVDEHHRYSTFIGVSADHHDGAPALMFEVDGFTGADSYLPGTTLRVFPSSDDVVLPNDVWRLVIYEPQEPRKDVPLFETNHYPLGSRGAKIFPIDDDPETCENYFGLSPGDVLDASYTVIGCKLHEGKVHCLFHESGHDGATVFSKCVSFFKKMDDRAFVHYEEGETLPMTHPSISNKNGFKSNTTYLFGDIAKPSRISVNDDPVVVESYFPGVVTGSRVDGKYTVLGVSTRGEKVTLVAVEDNRRTAGTFSEGTPIFVSTSVIDVKTLLIKPAAEDDGVSVTYKKAVQEAAYPIQPSFPSRLGLQQSYISLLDVDDDRCKHYFGVLPGQRINGFATAAGMRIEPSTEKIEMWFYVDGKKGAGTFSDDTVLHIEKGHRKKLIPVRTVHPIPTSAAKTVTVPSLSQDQSKYNFTVPFITRAGVKVMVDTTFLEKEQGWKAGQRFSHEGVYSVLTGVGVANANGVETVVCFFKCDEANGTGSYTAGTSMELYEHDVLPNAEKPLVNARQVTYNDQQFKPSVPLSEDTPVKVGMKNETINMKLDVDKERCMAYFGIAPGDRIDRKATCNGMLAEGGTVKMLFTVDGNPGAGQYSDGTKLLVETPEEAEPALGNSSMTRSGSSLFFAARQPTQLDVYIEGEEYVSPAAQEEKLMPNESTKFTSQSVASTKALQAIAKRSMELDEVSNKQVSEKLLEAGYPSTTTTLGHLTKYLAQDSPMVSWFNPSAVSEGRPCVEFMTEDLALRSSTELGIVNTGDLKLEEVAAMESKACCGAYDQVAPVHHPKRVLLNAFNDPLGPSPNKPKGDCFLVLSGLRYRSTLVSSVEKDEHVASPLVGGSNNLSPALVDDKLSASEFSALGCLAHGRQPWANSPTNPSVDFNLLVHGSVFFERHVSHVVISPSYAGRPAELKQLLLFAQKNGCFLIRTDVLQELVEKRNWSVDRLSRWLTAHQVDVNQDCEMGCDGVPCLTALPFHPQSRPLFRKVADSLCMKEMDRLTKIVEETNAKVWEDSSESKNAKKKEGPRGRSPPPQHRGRSPSTSSNASSSSDSSAGGGGDELTPEQQAQAMEALRVLQAKGDCPTQ